MTSIEINKPIKFRVAQYSNEYFIEVETSETTKTWYGRVKSRVIYWAPLTVLNLLKNSPLPQIPPCFRYIYDTEKAALLGIEKLTGGVN